MTSFEYKRSLKFLNSFEKNYRKGAFKDFNFADMGTDVRVVHKVA